MEIQQLDKIKSPLFLVLIKHAAVVAAVVITATTLVLAPIPLGGVGGRLITTMVLAPIPLGGVGGRLIITLVLTPIPLGGVGGGLITTLVLTPIPLGGVGGRLITTAAGAGVRSDCSASWRNCRIYDLTFPPAGEIIIFKFGHFRQLAKSFFSRLSIPASWRNHFFQDWAFPPAGRNLLDMFSFSTNTYIVIFTAKLLKNFTPRKPL